VVRTDLFTREKLRYLIFLETNMPQDDNQGVNNAENVNIDDNQAVNNAENVDIKAVALKLPPCWSKNMALWFSRCEAQFRLKNITADGTKFDHIVAVLEENLVEKAAAIISNPPQEGRYEKLKSHLLGHCDLPPLAKAQQLLHTAGLGDKRPSDLLSNMWATYSSLPEGMLFRALFLDQLPEDVRQILAKSDVDIHQLGQDADNTYFSRGKENPISAVRGSVPKNKTTKKGGSFSKGPQYCKFHRRWGMDARQCVQPCSF